MRILAGTSSSPQSREIARYAVRLAASGAPAAPRQTAEWVAELRRETEAASHVQREQASNEPRTLADTLLEIVVMAAIGGVVLGVPALVLWGLWRWRHRSPDDEPVERLPYIAAALTGLIVCLAIALATGRKEAWDSDLYYSFGIPVMALAIFVISYRYPERAWRWTLAMAVGQAAAMLAGGNSLSLWPLAIIAMLVVSVPQFVASFVASRLALRNAA